MDLFNKENLKELAQTRDSVCVSFFMPTYRFESELAQNPIRLKNVIKDARRQLLERGLREQEVEDILQPASTLLENGAYWLSMSDGLAGFLTKDSAQFYRLPVQFEELALCSDHFHLKPLYPLIASNSRFYILALSQRHVRLYQGTHYSISEVDAKEIPKSIVEALWYDDLESSSNPLRPGNRLMRAFSPAQHQSHGQSVDDVVTRPHDELYRFFHQIDFGLREALHDEKAPLILAGVEYYLPIYREVNKYPHLIDDTIIAGSPEYQSGKQLHEKAWEVMEPLLLKAQEESFAKFQEIYNKDRSLASDDLNEIVPAAVFSRIDTLFVPVGQHRWGTYDPDQNKVEVHEERRSGDEDLLDLAAMYTYLNGGTVHAVEETNMPVKECAAAMFRYPADVKAS